MRKFAYVCAVINYAYNEKGLSIFVGSFDRYHFTAGLFLVENNFKWELVIMPYI
jgi:hypothetical protein